MLTADICVIGGGVIGLLTAREFLLAGASVCIVEAGECGKESSWAGGGIVSPLYPWRYPEAVTALATWAQSSYPPLCDELSHNTQIDPQYRHSGLLLLAVSDRAEAIEWARQQRRHFDILTARDCVAVQADIQTFDEQALFFPDVAQVRNPRLMKALKADVLQHGAQIREHSPVTEFVHVDNKIVAAQTTRERIHAGSFIVCSGAWSGKLLQGLNSDLAVKPIRGQMLMFAAHRHSLQRIVLKNGRYLIPRADGRILCGSTVEDVGFDKSTTTVAHDSLLDSACEIMPSLRDQTIEMHWSGLRPGSPNGIPFISQLPSHDNVFVNAGQFRNGVALAPASARLMADLVLQRAAIVPPEPYRLNG